MFGTIIEVIAEFIFDFLHLREWRQRKKAKTEGKKQPFPIFTIISSTLAVLVLLFILIRILIHWPLAFVPDTQIDEMDSIVQALNRYNNNHGTYPENINILVQGIPIRKTWLTDSWGSEYAYKILPDSVDFELRSPGRDKELGTDDDLIRTSK